MLSIKKIHQQYGELMEIRNKIIKNKILKNQTDILPNTMVLYILDAAMSEHISLQHLSIKDGRISIDGIGTSDEMCRKFIAILQQKLLGMECHGTVKADKGVYTFHMDGSKRAQRIKVERILTGLVLWGCSLAFLCMGIFILKTKIIA